MKMYEKNVWENDTRKTINSHCIGY